MRRQNKARDAATRELIAECPVRFAELLEIEQRLGAMPPSPELEYARMEQQLISLQIRLDNYLAHDSPEHGG